MPSNARPDDSDRRDAQGDRYEANRPGKEPADEPADGRHRTQDEGKAARGAGKSGAGDYET